MPVSVCFGESGRLTIALDDQRLIGVCGCARQLTSGQASASDEPTADETSGSTSLWEALEHPLEFPDLAQASVEGDHVTIVVEPGTPRADEMVAAVAHRLIAGGASPDLITVLYGEEVLRTPIAVSSVATLVASGVAAARESESQSLQTERHDPADRGKLSFLANTRFGRPIYLNRLLTDADFVVSVGCYRGPDSWSYRGVYGGLYPTFSDSETLQRFRNPHLLDADDEAFAKSQQEIEAVGWQSGLQATVQLVPGPEGAATFVAGEARAVARRAARIWNAAWSRTFPRRADLVVAALSGCAAQTWQQVGRALAAALSVVDDGGAVALCTDLGEAPGKALEALAKMEDRDRAVAEIRKARPLDAFPALMLDRAQRRTRVYLLSKLDPAVVEELGMVPVVEAAEIERLSTRRRSCIILCDAQFADPRVG